MDMINVKSTSIHSIGYDETTKKMQIKFLGNFKTYIYCNVPKSIFDNFLNSISKGRYYHTNISGKYQCPEYFK